MVSVLASSSACSYVADGTLLPRMYLGTTLDLFGILRNSRVGNQQGRNEYRGERHPDDDLQAFAPRSRLVFEAHSLSNDHRREVEKFPIVKAR